MFHNDLSRLIRSYRSGLSNKTRFLFPFFVAVVAAAVVVVAAVAAVAVVAVLFGCNNVGVDFDQASFAADGFVRRLSISCC